MDRSFSFGTFIGGVILGGLMGAAIAILKAPQSGEDTVHELKNKSEKVRKDLEATAENYRQHAENLLAAVQGTKEEVGQAAEKAVK